MFENVNLVRSIAWSFHRSTGIDWKELFSEATAAYFTGLKFHEERHGMKLHNPEKGGKTTWIYQWIRGEMINFCKREQRFRRPEGIEDWYTNSSDVFNEVFPSTEHLSNDTKEIVEMVLQDPIRYAMPPRKAIGKIRQDLREIKKWSWPRVEAGMKNLRLEFQGELETA